ncbi:MAG: peptidoglycan editing factor PgeF [Gammaproteobacteria bacterium]|nr:peptidoglycan editing factor PgeF [Gammaproteobacteria bacterium]
MGDYVALQGLTLIKPNWPVPDHIKAWSTTRMGGVSEAGFGTFNTATHVNDALEAVTKNRAKLATALSLPSDPVWLDQVHETSVLNVDLSFENNVADASFSTLAGKVCVIQTADCLPVLLSDRAGTAVAAVHAGWRGLCAGVLEVALDRFSASPNDIFVWLGPAISRAAFVVGDEVRDAFMAQDKSAESCFQPSSNKNNNKWLADLYGLARQRLNTCGVENIFGGDWCTYTHQEHFYSYRRDGQTGRMASLIWMAEQP